VSISRARARRASIAGTLAALLASCALDVGEVGEEGGGVAVQQSALAATCTIQIGGGGNTYTYTASLDEGESKSWSSVTTSDFIRTTSGPCHFRSYNGADLTG